MSRKPRSLSPSLVRTLVVAVALCGLGCGSASSDRDIDDGTPPAADDTVTRMDAGLPPTKEPPAGETKPTGSKGDSSSGPDAAASDEKEDGPAARADANPETSPVDLGTAPGIPFDQKKLADGLVLLLDAKSDVTADGGKVTKWADQSGKGNHALSDMGRAPALKMNAAGVPFVQFSGKTNPKDGSGTGGPYLRIKDSPSLMFGKEDFQIVFVAAYSNALDATHMGAVGAFFAKWASNMELEFAGNWPVRENPNVERSFLFASFGERQPPGFASCDGSPLKPCEGLNDGKVRVYTLEKAGGTMYMRWNAQRAGRKGAYGSANLDVKADTFIGSMYVAGSADHGGTIISNKIVHALKGDVYYVAVHKGPLSDVDLGAYEKSLMARFSIEK